MKKRLLLVLSAVLIAMHPLPILAADAEDYEILREEYNELKSKYKKLKKKYNALKEKYEGTEETQEDAPIIEEIAKDQDAGPIGSYVYEDSKGYTYTYLRSEIVPHNDENHLVVYFNFDNHSGKEVMPILASSIDGYQNYVELDTFALYGSGIKELATASTNIRSGGNIDFAYSFKLQDMSDVTISLSPLFNFGGTEPYEFVIHLPGLEVDPLS